ncbi:hypothetical protein [Actinophytocola oryzae]|uniref:hypothetical protein n=1 Tax=Actinophytocola oryzae TaxID=502181 RepID=UPI0010636EB5|nr:hypothetical protein [Actinophytocola oryzae]
MTPAEIYRQLTEGEGTWSLRNEHDETGGEQSKEAERADLIRSLANTIRTGWHGEASAGAYGAAMPLAERALENADKLGHAQDLLYRQIDSFNRAVNSVRPISDPPQPSLDEKFPFDVDHDEAVARYQDDAQNNLAVFRAYDGASHYNETNLPQEYHTSDRSGGDVSVNGPSDVIRSRDPVPGAGEPRQNGPGDPPRPGDTGRVDGPRRLPVGEFPSGPTGPAGSQTTPNDYRPTPLPGVTYPRPGEPSPVSGGPGFVGGAPTGGFGPRGTAGGWGPGRGLGGESRGPGAGVGPLPAQEAAARRAAQAAAGARSGGLAPMGGPTGGRGKDDEDAEHRRKVLMESDAEEMFGSDVLTAPQVIGDDEYED